MNDITVIIPVSPIPSHPSTEVLDATLDSIRQRLPSSEVIIMFDGVKHDMADRRADYNKFVAKMVHKCNLEIFPALPLVFGKHMHQTLMTKKALDLVRTPLVLFAEQDTPLTGDIPLDKIGEVIKTGYANVVRFHHEASVHPEHEYLMLDHSPIDILGVPFLRGRQWSQRPHLASTKYYRDIAEKYWDDEPRFIEHVMYGAVVEGEYDDHRLHIYAPSGTLVRSLHLDGRRKGAKDYDPNPS